MELADLARGSCKTSFPDLSLSLSLCDTHTHHPLHLSTRQRTSPYSSSLFLIPFLSLTRLCAFPAPWPTGGGGTRGGAGLVYHPGYPASLTLRNKSQPSPSWQSHLLA